MPAQPGYFDGSPTFGAFPRYPTQAVPQTGAAAQTGQGSQDFGSDFRTLPSRDLGFSAPFPTMFSSPRVAPSRVPEPLGREPPSIRPALSKEADLFLGSTPYTGSTSAGSDSGMSLDNILSSGMSITDQRRAIIAPEGMFGLENLHREGLLNDFLTAQKLQREPGGRGNTPRDFLHRILNRMYLRPSNLLGGRF